MDPRPLATPLKHRLSRSPTVALLGPRQVGKTTLSMLCRAAKGALYVGKENPADLDKLSDQAIGVRQLAQELALFG